MVNAANLEERKESEYADGFKASRTELLLVDKGNYREVVVSTKTEEVGLVFFPPYPLLSTSSSLATVRMLCFGREDDYHHHSGVLSVSPNSTQNCKPSTKKKAKPSTTTGGDGEKEVRRRRRRQGSPCSASSCSELEKGKKTEASPVSKTGRMGRGKLGAHVKALQQLVSPAGKWDTASVLQEAFQCIRFLHEQIKVLSSAYMEARTESAMERVWKVVAEGDLRRRGLCLVPVSSMLSAACTPASFEH
ncbi:Transcription factor bHLH123 [Platanthera zijinensis]|uniref:Transcription factor bHLH123 n=1 Tax=Platanthera zijinensis TaxID=2320716 RepID=A0AAP0FY95_9ASPA